AARGRSADPDRPARRRQDHADPRDRRGARRARAGDQPDLRARADASVARRRAAARARRRLPAGRRRGARRPGPRLRALGRRRRVGCGPARRARLLAGRRDRASGGAGRRRRRRPGERRSRNPRIARAGAARDRHLARHERRAGRRRPRVRSGERRPHAARRDRRPAARAGARRERRRPVPDRGRRLRHRPGPVHGPAGRDRGRARLRGRPRRPAAPAARARGGRVRGALPGRRGRGPRGAGRAPPRAVRDRVLGARLGRAPGALRGPAPRRPRGVRRGAPRGLARADPRRGADPPGRAAARRRAPLRIRTAPLPARAGHQAAGSAEAGLRMILRPATEADLDAIWRIEADVFAGEAWSREMMREELTADHRHYIALERADERRRNGSDRSGGRTPGARYRDELRRDRRGHRARAHAARQRRGLLHGRARPIRRRRARGRRACARRGDRPDHRARGRRGRHLARRARRHRRDERPRPRRRAHGRGRRGEVPRPRARQAALRGQPPRRPCRSRSAAGRRAATRGRRRDRRARTADRRAAGLGRPHVPPAGPRPRRRGRAVGRDHRRRRGRSLRQGRPPARPALPGRPAHRPRGGRGRPERDPVPARTDQARRPRAPPVRLLLLGTQDLGRALGGAHARCRRRGAGRRRRRELPRGRRRRAHREGDRRLPGPRGSPAAAGRRRRGERARPCARRRARGGRRRDPARAAPVALHRQRRHDRLARGPAGRGRARALDPRLRCGFDAARHRGAGGRRRLSGDPPRGRRFSSERPGRAHARSGAGSAGGARRPGRASGAPGRTRRRGAAGRGADPARRPRGSGRAELRRSAALHDRYRAEEGPRDHRHGALDRGPGAVLPPVPRDPARVRGYRAQHRRDGEEAAQGLQPHRPHRRHPRPGRRRGHRDRGAARTRCAALDEQRRVLARRAGEHERRPFGPAELEPGAQRSGVDVDPALLDLESADRALREGAPQLRFFDGQRLEHAERRRERRRHERVARQVGDPVAQHAGPQLLGEQADEPGSDHGPVGFVEEPAERAHLGVVGVGIGVQLIGDGFRIGIPGGAQDERRAPDARTRGGPEPQPHLDELPADRDPLGFGIGGDEFPVEAGAELDTGRHPFGEAEGEAERGRVVVGAGEPSGIAMPRGAAGGIEERGVGVGRAQRLGVADAHAVVGAGNREVMGGERRRQRIELHRARDQARFEHGERLGADPAAEIGDPGRSRRPEPGRVALGDGEAGGLLEARRGEEHACGAARSELGRGADAEAVLGQRRRDQSGIGPLGAQPASDRGGVEPGHGGRVDAVEQLEAGGRRELIPAGQHGAGRRDPSARSSGGTGLGSGLREGGAGRADHHEDEADVEDEEERDRHEVRVADDEAGERDAAAGIARALDLAEREVPEDDARERRDEREDDGQDRVGVGEAHGGGLGLARGGAVGRGRLRRDRGVLLRRGIGLRRGRLRNGELLLRCGGLRNSGLRAGVLRLLRADTCCASTIRHGGFPVSSGVCETERRPRTLVRGLLSVERASGCSVARVGVAAGRCRGDHRDHDDESDPEHDDRGAHVSDDGAGEREASAVLAGALDLAQADVPEDDAEQRDEERRDERDDRHRVGGRGRGVRRRRTAAAGRRRAAAVHRRAGERRRAAAARPAAPEPAGRSAAGRRTAELRAAQAEPAARARPAARAAAGAGRGRWGTTSRTSSSGRRRRTPGSSRPLPNILACRAVSARAHGRNRFRDGAAGSRAFAPRDHLRIRWHSPCRSAKPDPRLHTTPGFLRALAQSSVHVRKGVNRVGCHQAARGSNRHQAGRGRADHRFGPRHPRQRQGEAPGGRGRGSGPRPRLRQRRSRPARYRGRRRGDLLEVRRHRGQGRRRRLPRALGSRRPRGRHPLSAPRPSGRANMGPGGIASGARSVRSANFRVQDRPRAHRPGPRRSLDWIDERKRGDDAVQVGIGLRIRGLPHVGSLPALLHRHRVGEPARGRAVAGRHDSHHLRADRHDHPALGRRGRDPALAEEARRAGARIAAALRELAALRHRRDLGPRARNGPRLLHQSVVHDPVRRDLLAREAIAPAVDRGLHRRSRRARVDGRLRPVPLDRDRPRRVVRALRRRAPAHRRGRRRDGAHRRDDRLGARGAHAARDPRRAPRGARRVLPRHARDGVRAAQRARHRGPADPVRRGRAAAPAHLHRLPAVHDPGDRVPVRLLRHARGDVDGALDRLHRGLDRARVPRRRHGRDAAARAERAGDGRAQDG
uniref:GNAT family N-acetyltransferase n=1 Tax=Parastrongyloides trichosuri TaxID=131310 RepID=A0A0N5A0Y4_PARTI